MKKVFLIHQDKIQHYRIPIYNYLHDYLIRNGFKLTVVSEGVQEGCDCRPIFPIKEMRLRFLNLARLTVYEKPVVIILFINHRKIYFFPYLLYLRWTGKKVATWTHGMDLQSKYSIISRLAHEWEHNLCHGIILYAEHLRCQLAKPHQGKVFVANNTLNLTRYDRRRTERVVILKKYGITTVRNIVFVGRIHKRKRINDLFKAFELLVSKEAGLIIVGPDEQGLAAELKNKMKNVFVLGPLYGDDAIDLMRASDVYCIPGAIGLSIVDALYCGLPVVTEDVPHGPEIMYLKEGQNGFIVPKGDSAALSDRLNLLLANDELRKSFSGAARKVIETNGHIERLCEGFLACLQYLTP